MNRITEDEVLNVKPALQQAPCYVQPGCQLYNQDCIETMKRIETGSIDLIIQDPPYNITANDWEYNLNLPELWEEWLRISKPNAALIFTAQQPFTSELILSKKDIFKYCWYWDKGRPKNHLNAKIQPMRVIEDIVVFYRQQPTYTPILKKKRKQDIRDNGRQYNNKNNGNYGKTKEVSTLNEFRSIDIDLKYPDNLLCINGVGSFGFEKEGHPTQKPFELMRYLIKTYSLENDLVFDGYSGSGTTAAACIKEKRRFIGSELSKEYFDKSVERLELLRSQPELF